MAISDKLQDLIDIKQDIKEAIENKGADLTGVDFGGYAEKIDEIPLPKEEQTKTVTDPNFSSGNVVVTPDSGKVLTQVTVVKDANLIADNIKSGVTIFGVTGTLEPEPSVYDITFSKGKHSTGYAIDEQYFSIDNGATWTQLISSSFDLLVDMLNDVNMIKFKINNAKIEIDNIVFADRLDNNGEFVTDNYILTKDVDIYVGVGYYSSGGGGN